MKKLEPKEKHCVCEKPGHFRCGVPGILAHVENGRLMSKVERCDACRRYRDDGVADEALRNLLTMHAPQPHDHAKTRQSQKE